MREPDLWRSIAGVELEAKIPFSVRVGSVDFRALSQHFVPCILLDCELTDTMLAVVEWELRVHLTDTRQVEIAEAVYYYRLRG